MTQIADRALQFTPGPPERFFHVHDVTGSASSVTASMNTGRWTHGAHGIPTFGALGVFIDVLLATPLLTGRPPGHWGVTTSMSIEFCARVPDTDSTLTGFGRTVHRAALDGVSYGMVRTADGIAVAVGSQQIRFIPDVRDPEGGRPGAAASPGDRTLLELLGATSHITEDGFELHLRADPIVANPTGTMHGGIVLCLSEVSASMAVYSRSQPVEASSIHVAYVRPGPADGTVRFKTQVSHRGRSSAAVRVDCLRPDGKVCAVATVTFRHRFD